jgi:2-C-methyl-D-erythritol 4-phosphate cytidylyltransferase
LKTFAILVGAGRGERMRSGRPKAFLTLAGESLLVRAHRAFEESTAIDGTVVVVPETRVDETGRLLAGSAKLHAVVPGGVCRQDSVLAGLKHLPSSFDGIVLVHDAARPLVGGELIAAVASAAARYGAALPVVPIADTVKRVRDGIVEETLDRDELGAAQTPQGFRAGLLREAYERALSDGAAITDEAMAVERLGHPVAVVPGRPTNRKLTTPEDLSWAELLLERVGAVT